MSQKILVFAGKKQSGKSSAANFVVGYTLSQLGRRGYPFCPTNFAIDENGQLIVNTVVSDSEGNGIASDGILDLNRKDAEFIRWSMDVMWPHVKTYAFADALKNVAITILGIDPQIIYGNDDDKNKKTHIKWKDMCSFIAPRQVSSIKKGGKFEDNMSGRELLQYLGTNIFRVLDNECWHRKCFNDILMDGSDIAIVQDCRFTDEVKASYKIKEKWGVDVKVIKLAREGEFDMHESENALKGISDSGYDLVIDNQHMTIKEKNLEILDYLYECGWFSEHLPLESKE
jgi:hypothetical protein